MKVWIFLCISLTLLSLTLAGPKKKAKKAKKAAKKVDASSEALTGSLAANLSALWEKVNSMGNGVQIHIHGMEDAEPKMDNDVAGTHIHLHINDDDDEDDDDYDRYRDMEGDNEYCYAVCHVQSNTALPDNEQQPIKGSIFFRQMRHKHLEVKVHLEGFDMSAANAQHAHGLHGHEFGDLSNGCQSLGGHFNPYGTDHAGPNNKTRPIGDFDDIKCDDNGVVHKTFYDHHIDLGGRYSIVGRSIVIHRGPDSSATNVDASGGAGDRIACCVVVASPKLEWDTIHGDLEKTIEIDEGQRGGHQMGKHDHHKEHGHHHANKAGPKKHKKGNKKWKNKA